MPSAPDYLQKMWGDGAEDGERNACAHLKNAGFKLTRRFTWVLPSPTYELTQKDCDALDYMCLEWDFGGVEDWKR